MITEPQIKELAADRPTPFYMYDMELLGQTIRAAQHAIADRPDFKIHYALKANSNGPIIDTVARAGLGADTVSAGEIKLAIDAGIKPEDIVFAGVGKTDSEILYALQAGVGTLNIESLEELEIVSQLAAEHGYTAKVALRINPDIDAHTHHYITTGVAENKFGIDADKALDAVQRCLELPGIKFKGLHFHIGSQITELEPYSILCKRALALVDEVEKLFCPVETIDFGGGLGIDYDNPVNNPIAPFDRMFSIFKQHAPQVEGRTYHFEPGRSLVAQCGSLISRVVYVKQGRERNYVILDAGMTELIRPALYQALHRIDNVSAEADAPVRHYDIVGPVCESTDTFAQDYPMVETHRNEIIPIRWAGA